MKPLNLLTQGLSLQSAITPLAGGQAQDGQDGTDGLTTALQAMNLGGGDAAVADPKVNESFGGLQAQGPGPAMFGGHGPAVFGGGGPGPAVHESFGGLQAQGPGPAMFGGHGPAVFGGGPGPAVSPSFGGLQAPGSLGGGGQSAELQKVEMMLMAVMSEVKQEDSGSDPGTDSSADPGTDGSGMTSIASAIGGGDGKSTAANMMGGGGGIGGALSGVGAAAAAGAAAGEKAGKDFSDLQAQQKASGQPVSTNSDDSVKNGDATNGAKDTDKAPAGMTADDISKLDGGLLAKTGNQELTGDGTNGIKGSKHIMDIVGSQVQGGGPKGSAADQAWQKLEVLEQAKNAPQANGQQASADVRHNGNMSGFQPSGEVASNSDLAYLQNEAKGAGQTKGGESDKMNDNDGETSGAQQVGKKILDGLGKVANFFKSAIDNTIGKIPGIGKIFSAGADLIDGGISDGLNAAGDAADGHMDDAKEDGKKMGHDALATISQAADQASGLLKSTLGKIPGIGKLLAAGGQILDSAVVGTTNVLNTGLEGGSMTDAADNMGKNLLGATVGAGVGMIDPTGVGADLAQNGVDQALGATNQVVQS